VIGMGPFAAVRLAAPVVQGRSRASPLRGEVVFRRRAGCLPRWGSTPVL